MNRTALVAEHYEGRQESAGDANGRHAGRDPRVRSRLGALAAGGAFGLGAAAVLAATPGLPFTETFDDATLSDTALTTADWGVSTAGKLTFPSASSLTGTFSAASPGEDIGGPPQETRSVAFADMNGDGWLDLVQGGEGLNGVYLNDGTGAFLTRVDLPGTTANTRGIAVGDVDGDGDLDIVAGVLNAHPSRLYLNSGDGVTYTPSDIGNISRPTDSIALADFNGDGLLDVAIGNHLGFFNYVYLNTGDSAAPFSATDTGLQIANRANDTQSLLAGDLDNDGDIDLVEINQNQGNTYYVNDGMATFAVHNLGAEADNSQSGALADFNGDGFLDVFVGNFPVDAATPGQSKVYLNTGVPTDPFGAVTPVLIGNPNDPPNVHGASVADIDNDGDIDILAATAGMGAASPTTRFPNFVIMNDGTGTAWTVVPIGADTAVTNSIAAADVDGDNDLDIVTGNEDRDAANEAVPLADRLYRNAGQPSGTNALQLSAHARSLRVDNASTTITSVSLGIDPESLGTHNRADFWVSSNGGANWVHINPNARPVTLPEPVSGQDLRWRVDLRSLSPAADVGAAGLAIDTLTLSTDAPTFTSTPITDATAGTAYTYAMAATDPNGDTVTFKAPDDAPLPAWLTLTDNGDGTATLTGTPAETDVGKTEIEIDASDGTHITKQSFVLSVASANTAPSFTSTPPTSAATDAAYTYAVVATDPNPGDTLTLTAPTLPAWLTLTDNLDGTGTLTGTPTASDVGDAAVQLQVADAGGAVATQDFTISVVAGNAPPSFTSTPVAAATEAQAYTYNVTASDPNAGDAITISAASLPAWLMLTDNGDGTATLTGTPGAGDVGDVAVQLQAADSAGATATQDFTITVSAASGGGNTEPSFTSTAVTSATAGTAYSYAVTTADADASDTRTITSTGTLPAWLTLTDNGDGTATLAGTPAASDVGSVPVELQVADAAGATANQTFTITVAAASSGGGGGGSTTPPPSSGGGGGGGSAGLGELGLLMLLAGLRRRLLGGASRGLSRLRRG